MQQNRITKLSIGESYLLQFRAKDKQSLKKKNTLVGWPDSEARTIKTNLKEGKSEMVNALNRRSQGRWGEKKKKNLYLGNKIQTAKIIFF